MAEMHIRLMKSFLVLSYISGLYQVKLWNSCCKGFGNSWKSPWIIVFRKCKNPVILFFIYFIILFCFIYLSTFCIWVVSVKWFNSLLTPLLTVSAGGNPQHMSEEFLDGKSTKLYINDISQADTGEYVCMVGHIMAKFLIGLQGKIICINIYWWVIYQNQWKTYCFADSFSD